ncbi:MAG: 6-carboxytetrahydropterin synthase [Candidatus Auribacterota bacterium]
MLLLTKKVRFCCSHTLRKKEWSDQKNFEVFGQCSNLHGHNYILEVTVRGDINDESGMIINLNTVGKIVNEKIVNVIDHTNLNTDIPAFTDRVPTLENMVMVFWDWLEQALPPGTLAKLTLYETENNKIEYTKE